ncbi:MAG: hypothetical protein PHD48_01900 [Alphaproteobacteria bacterium]|nr:hypothetical protein [Alphaproteobacteria bacterium]
MVDESNMVDESVDAAFEQDLQKNYNFILEHAKTDPDLAPFNRIKDLRAITSGSLYQFHSDLLKAVEARTYDDNTADLVYEQEKIACIHAIAIEHQYREERSNPPFVLDPDFEVRPTITERAMSEPALQPNWDDVVANGSTGNIFTAEETITPNSTTDQTRTLTNEAEGQTDEWMQELYDFLRQQSTVDPDLEAFASVQDYSTIDSQSLNQYGIALLKELNSRHYGGDENRATYDHIKLNAIQEMARVHERREQNNIPPSAEANAASVLEDDPEYKTVHFFGYDSHHATMRVPVKKELINEISSTEGEETQDGTETGIEGSENTIISKFAKLTKSLFPKAKKVAPYTLPLAIIAAPFAAHLMWQAAWHIPFPEKQTFAQVRQQYNAKLQPLANELLKGEADELDYTEAKHIVETRAGIPYLVSKSTANFSGNGPVSRFISSVTKSAGPTILNVYEDHEQSCKITSLISPSEQEKYKDFGSKFKDIGKQGGMYYFMCRFTVKETSPRTSESVATRDTKQSVEWTNHPHYFAMSYGAIRINDKDHSVDVYDSHQELIKTTPGKPLSTQNNVAKTARTQTP